MRETIEVKKSCGLCAHYSHILLHCAVGGKTAIKGTTPCEKFVLHSSYEAV